MEGEGFAHDGDVYYIKKNSIHAAVMAPGPIVFADNWDSDSEEQFSSAENARTARVRIVASGL